MTNAKPWEKMSTMEQVASDLARAKREAKTSSDHKLIAHCVGKLAAVRPVAAAPAARASSYSCSPCPNPRVCGNPGCDGRCGY